jgi:hypothetical protein
LRVSYNLNLNLNLNLNNFSLSTIIVGARAEDL